MSVGGASAELAQRGIMKERGQRFSRHAVELMPRGTAVELMRFLAFDMEERCDWGYHCEGLAS
jgi:hypothetical protein